MEAKAEMGEMALFLIGAVLSLLLLSVLFFPFVTRFKVRTRAEVKGRSPDDLANLVGQTLARSGFSVDRLVVPESSAPPAAHSGETSIISKPFVAMLQAIKGAGRFQIHLTAPADDPQATTLIELVQEGLTVEQRAAMTMLTGTPLGWCAVVIDLAFKRAGLKPTWREHAAQAPAATPLTPLNRLVISFSPWH